MGTVNRTSRIVGRVGVVAAIVGGVVAASAVPADANNYIPAGCAQVPLQNWSTNCYASPTATSGGPYVTAVQTALQGNLYFAGQCIDASYGWPTTSAVQQYQTAKSLTSDGVVGAQTWSSLNGSLMYMSEYSIGTTRYKYHGAGADTSTQRFIKVTNSGFTFQRWMVRAPNYSCGLSTNDWKNLTAY